MWRRCAHRVTGGCLCSVGRQRWTARCLGNGRRRCIGLCRERHSLAVVGAGIALAPVGVRAEPVRPTQVGNGGRVVPPVRVVEQGGTLRVVDPGLRPPVGGAVARIGRCLAQLLEISFGRCTARTLGYRSDSSVGTQPPVASVLLEALGGAVGRHLGRRVDAGRPSAPKGALGLLLVSHAAHHAAPSGHGRASRLSPLGRRPTRASSTRDTSKGAQVDQVWKWANLTLAFLLEVVAIVALGIWGWHVGGNRAVQILLAVGLPALAVVLWGLVAARHPRYDVPSAARVVK